MRTLRIPAPIRSVRSWIYLAGIALFWIAARALEPTSGGAELRGVWLPPCPLKALSGIPCPFCGLTTGVAWLSRWQWREAWNSNVLSPLMLLLSVVLAVYTLLMRFLAGYAVEWSARDRGRIWFATGLLVVLSWAVNLLRAP